MGGITPFHTGFAVLAEADDDAGLPEAAITAASEAHALNATFSDTEAEAALDALGATVNEIIAVLETKGLIEAN